MTEQELTAIYNKAKAEGNQRMLQESGRRLAEMRGLTKEPVQVEPQILEQPEGPGLASQILGGIQREVLSAAPFAAGGAVVGAPIGGVGAIPGALAGLGTYGIARASDAITSLVSSATGTQYNSPFDALEDFYTRLGVPEPQERSAKAFRDIFQSLITAPTSGARAIKDITQAGLESVGAEAAQSGVEAAGLEEVSPVAGIAAPLVIGRRARVDEFTPGQQIEGVPVEYRDLQAPSELAETARRAETGDERALRQLASEARPSEEALEAARRLGIEDYIEPGHITTNEAFMEVTEALKRQPQSPLLAREMEGLEAISEKSVNLIDDLGATNLSQLSDNVKSEITKNLNELKAKEDSLYGKISSSIPPKTKGPLTSVKQFLDSKGPVERKELKKILGITDPKMKLMDYSDIDFIRRKAGTKRSSLGKDYKPLYAAITEDQNRIIESVNPDLVSDWDIAKKASIARFAMEDDMTSLFGKAIDQSLLSKLKSSKGAISRGDAEQFERLIKKIPQNRKKEVALGAIELAFNNKLREGSLDFKSFSEWYEALNANKKAYNALMENIPVKGRNAIRDLAKVSGSIARATNLRKKGVSPNVRDALNKPDRLLSKIFSQTPRIGAGLIGEAALSRAGLPHGFAIGSAIAYSTKDLVDRKGVKEAFEVMNSPKFIMLSRELAKGNTVSDKMIKSFVASPQFSRYARAVNLSDVEEENLNWVKDALSDTTEEKTEELKTRQFNIK